MQLNFTIKSSFFNEIDYQRNWILSKNKYNGIGKKKIHKHFALKHTFAYYAFQR